MRLLERRVMMVHTVHATAIAVFTKCACKGLGSCPLPSKVFSSGMSIRI